MRKYFLFIVIIGFLASCGTVKKAPTGTAEALSVKELFNNHTNTKPEFETLAARVQVSHRTADKSHSISVNIRMKKDEIIWAKASILGITVAKVLITPDKVSYYETIGKTYFEGDYSLLSEWLGIAVNFEQTQNILLGQSLFDLKPGKYNMEISQNKFKVQPKKQLPNFIHSLFINPGDFRVTSTVVEQPEYGRVLHLKYLNYQIIKNQYFPTQISVVSTEPNEQTQISIDFRKIDLNPSFGFPFEIPSGYERIEL